ncbi:hypothetical protein [Puia sp.]|jgi:hypothetical protein|uniref:hypothetical protein n=1 Tax=Puia sp. TaxID=2045100 RepID=UPI002F3E896D
MRKNLLLAPLCLLFLVAFTDGGKSLVGRWKAAYGNKITGEMVLQSNGHFDATFTGQTWKVGGEYKMDGSTLSITDTSCGYGYWAKYKSQWYSDDSVKFIVIEDSCSGRRANGDGIVLVRMKK